jgi:hypothetical protein
MPAPRFTTYDGYIKLPSGQRMDVSLEFFKAQEKKEWRKVKAYLKVFLNKDEFLTFSYDQVKYNFETGLLNLESEEKSVTLSNLSYMDHDEIGMLTGEASIDFGSVRGEIKLQTRDPEQQDIRLKSDFSISGEFEGICDGVKKKLQIQTARSFQKENIETTNPLSNFLISGVIGTDDEGAERVESFISEAYYDPFRSAVSLKLNKNGAISSLNCIPEMRLNKILGLNCDNLCNFKRKANIASPALLNAETAIFKKDDAKLISEQTPASELSGSYKGIIALKNSLNLPLEFKIVAKRYATNAMVITKNYLSGNLEFLTAENKKLSYKIKERPFLDSSSVVNKNQNVLLLETHNKIEIVVSKWTESGISGDIYHADYGFLGTFQAKKAMLENSAVLENPQAISYTPSIDGTFKNEMWTLSLESSEIEQSHSTSIYSPLHIKGILKTKDNSLKLIIVDGSYDFALNVVYLKTEDGRLIKGFIQGNDIEIILPSKPMRRTKYLNSSTSRFSMRRN